MSVVEAVPPPEKRRSAREDGEDRGLGDSRFTKEWRRARR